MSLRKRWSVWWIDIRAPNGERIRQSTGTDSKALAQELHDKLKAEVWRISKLGDRPRHSWNDAVVQWLKEQAHKATINEDNVNNSSDAIGSIRAATWPTACSMRCSSSHPHA